MDQGKRNTEKIPHGYTCPLDALSMRLAQYHIGIRQVSSTNAVSSLVQLGKRRVDARTQRLRLVATSKAFT